MGTNYYIHQNVCSQCGRGDDPVHVGKYSSGWKFSFNGTERKTIAEWISYLREHEGKMKNEYGDPVSTDELLQLIRNNRDGVVSMGAHKCALREWIEGDCRFIPGEYS